MPQMETEKAKAADWFRALRDQIVSAFEALEDSQTTVPFSDLNPGRFEVRETSREGGGGGLMSVMRNGRVFEKVGVNVSAVHGELSEPARKAMAARKDIPGIDDDPRFWA